MNAKRTRMVEREILLVMLNGAIACGELNFARQAALAWLGAYPGDLEVRLLQARILTAEEHPVQSVQALEQIIRRDPLYADVYVWLAQVSHGFDQNRRQQALTNLFALGREVNDSKILLWGEAVRAVYRHVDAHEWEEAGRLMPAMLRKAPDSPLAAVLHLRWSQAVQDSAAVLQLAQLYSSRWPECLPIKLLLASTLMAVGNEQEGVRLMYQCASGDAAGQAAERLWGEDQPYRSLWPDEMLIMFDQPIPAGVAAYLGWNQLEAGGKNSPQAEEAKPQPLEKRPVQAEPAKPKAGKHEDGSNGSGQNKPAAEKSPKVSPLHTVETEFERLAKKLGRPGLAHEDGRYPVYVIFSTRSGLVKEYGAQTAAIIDQELRRLAGLISQRTGWETLLFYPDDAASAEKMGTHPADASDPWKLKLALADLDRSLAHRGEMVGCLFIVGGDRVVPFHRLPNPTDDLDREVPSDSPYGTLDSNYFVPEWPVGRLPGEPGPDAGFLLEQIRRMQRFYSKQLAQEKVKTFWFNRLIEMFGGRRGTKKSYSMGYTAAIWRRSSMAVFRPIGSPHTILTSPPEYSGTIDVEHIMGAGLGYYNLHGTEESADWYGQRDPTEGGKGPDYPVALSPGDLRRNGKAPRVIFSEACYGGQILGKNENQSLAMKFLAVGAQAVVASTCVAYGSVTMPLISADLLGSLFWKHLKAGRVAGEALFQARIDLANEMDRRQGYLDAEDQKALISFILLGDPLAFFDGSLVHNKATRRLKDHPAVNTVVDKDILNQSAVSSDVIKRAKELAAEYLPGANLNLNVHLARQEPQFESDQKSATLSKKRKSFENGTGGHHTVLTVRKEVRVAKYVHHHYLRVTLDEQGAAVKLVVSR